jgi:hypothetical protein
MQAPRLVSLVVEKLNLTTKFSRLIGSDLLSYILGAVNPLCVTLKFEKSVPVCFPPYF